MEDERSARQGITPNDVTFRTNVQGTFNVHEAAWRLAVECPLSGNHVLFIAADDSSCPQPLADVVPSLLPGIGEMARALAGTIPAVSNARAKLVLGWKPEHSWRARAN